MIKPIQRGIVSGLDRACSVIDSLPAPAVDGTRIVILRHGQWGCRIGVAQQAFNLTDRWGI